MLLIVFACEAGRDAIGYKGDEKREIKLYWRSSETSGLYSCETNNLNSIQTPVTTVFVDILGFARLVEQNEGAEGLLDSFYTSSKSIDDFQWGISRFSEDHPALPPLEAVFSAFHRVLEVHIDRALQASHLTAIVFSDSAFVAFEHTEIAFDFAQSTMRTLISAFRPSQQRHCPSCQRPISLITITSAAKAMMAGIITLIRWTCVR